MASFETIKLSTKRRSQLVRITRQVETVVSAAGVTEGFCVVYSPHTTAGITINEAADPDVAADMEKAMDKHIPWHDGYAHSEGNSAAHIKTTLCGPSVTIPIHKGKLTLGTWQGIYFCEWDGPRSRSIFIQTIGS